MRSILVLKHTHRTLPSHFINSRSKQEQEGIRMNIHRNKKMSNIQLVVLILKVIFAGIILYNALFAFCKFVLIF